MAEHDEVTPNQVHTAYRERVKQYNKERRRHRQLGSYLNTSHYFYILVRLGLIEFVREEQPGPGDPPIPRRYYRAVRHRLDDPAWDNPQQSLYPSTGMGRSYIPKYK